MVGLGFPLGQTSTRRRSVERCCIAECKEVVGDWAPFRDEPTTPTKHVAA